MQMPDKNDLEATRRLRSSVTLVDMNAAITRLGGSRTFYDKVVASFREEVAHYMVDLQRFLAEGDYHHAMHRVHTLKGLAGTVGATALSVRAAQFEALLNPWQDAAASEQPTDAERASIAHLLQPLELEMAQTLDALDQLPREPL